ncbi:SMI1/KNR4 family protein [Niabella beijingensis]|uniref:SMI1/KNR4 family protein n=1 Tax=Niabella beijingensis TaxID=2872700 RepID=UPI001CBC1A87|nr:SMI1/KNR4 family protein [Niabella beijingensis]
MQQQLERIRAKLGRLSDLDSKRQLFGAAVHNYHMNPVLRPQQIQLFEAKHRVQLPEEYVAFLTVIGDGGAGPFNGLHRLERGRICFFDPGEKGAHIYFDLSKPFPHTEKWNMDAEMEGLDARLEAALMTGDENLEQQLFEKKWELIDGSEHDHGRLFIADYGGGAQISLIVNGQEKGNIWTDDRINNRGIYPSMELGNTGTISFLNWYELWLDKALTKMEHSTHLSGRRVAV